MAYCVACGKAVKDEDRFCPFCGTETVDAGGQQQARTKASPITPTRGARFRGRLAAVPVGGIVVAVIAAVVLVSALTDGGGNKPKPPNPPLGRKLLGAGLTSSDTAAMKTIFQANERMRKTTNALVGSVSMEAFLAEVDAAQGQLGRDLDIITGSANSISDPDVHQFFDVLPGALQTEVDGLNSMAAGLRNRTNSDLESGRHTFNRGVRRVHAFARQYQAAVKPYR